MGGWIVLFAPMYPGARRICLSVVPISVGIIGAFLSLEGMGSARITSIWGLVLGPILLAIGCLLLVSGVAAARRAGVDFWDSRAEEEPPELRLAP